jgi:hypothetical protein
MATIGIVLIAGALLGFGWVGRRKFYRTNKYGVEEFESWGRAVRTQLLEGVVALVCLVAFFVGIMILVLL